MARASTTRRFPGWASTARELQETVHALREMFPPDARLSVMVRSFLVPERGIAVEDLATHLREKEPFQIVVKVEGGDERDILVVLGPVLPAPATAGEDEDEEGPATSSRPRPPRALKPTAWRIKPCLSSAEGSRVGGSSRKRVT